MSFTPEELLERRSYLNGSESSASIGLSPFYTERELYDSKFGLTAPIEETIPMMVGTALEPVALKLLERETGHTVSHQQQRLVDPIYPWRRATIDGRTSDGGLIEAKTSGIWADWGKEQDAIPAHYQYQIHHTFAIDETLKFCWVPVILSQREFRLYRVDRDEEMIQLLTLGEITFWNRVQMNDPPAPKSQEDLRRLYPNDTGAKLVATAEIEADAYKLAQVKSQLKRLKEEEDLLALNLKAYMERAAVLVDGKGVPLFTYKSHQVDRIDVTRLRKEQPQIADAYTKTSTDRPLRNKIKE